MVCVEKIFAQKVARKTFFGQVWGKFRQKLSCPPKFACSYTYVL